MNTHLHRLALLAPVLLLAGCPDRPRNRGTDVPEHAGERFPESGNGTSTKAPHDAGPETQTAPKDESTKAAEPKK